MKIFVVHEDPWNAGNPYIYTLIEDIQNTHPGCGILWEETWQGFLLFPDNMKRNNVNIYDNTLCQGHIVLQLLGNEFYKVN